jgi:hypothetical protein
LIGEKIKKELYTNNFKVLFFKRLISAEHLADVEEDIFSFSYKSFSPYSFNEICYSREFRDMFECFFNLFCAHDEQNNNVIWEFVSIFKIIDVNFQKDLVSFKATGVDYYGGKDIMDNVYLKKSKFYPELVTEIMGVSEKPLKSDDAGK